MNLNIAIAKLEELPIVQNLLQLYLHDFSEIDGDDVGPDGLYDYPWLKEYWDSPNHAYLIRVEGHYAGFCLVDKLAVLDDSEICISEFFILRKYRRTGIGREAAKWIFAQHPARWEVAVQKENWAASKFWTSVIEEYTDGDFDCHDEESDDWTGPVYAFQSRQLMLDPLGGV
ncbi:GNAT family N-acetyltransferase [Chitinivorax sp. B]|uniref:GNAT family N-acetyltransferase n=1 Tax=Chitinivorax sp. B TaxID=2502235 RepID=UPI0010F571F0|nr:GNAT family N-acetyltransferase [Chitinivorax sp. B]